MQGRRGWTSWPVLTGAGGLACLVIGSFCAGTLPAIDAEPERVIDFLADRRAAVLGGALLTITASVLLLAPLVEMSVRLREAARETAAWFALATWVIALSLLALSAVAFALGAWRDPHDVSPDVVQFAYDAHHLVLWGLSAPVAAIAVIATTVPARSVGLAPVALVVLAGVKVATTIVEIAGVWATTGWNAGGYAASISGVATVAWFTALLVTLGRTSRRSGSEPSNGRWVA